MKFYHQVDLASTYVVEFQLNNLALFFMQPTLVKYIHHIH